jgi:hypothetical protein
VEAKADHAVMIPAVTREVTAAAVAAVVAKDKTYQHLSRQGISHEIP